MSGGARRESLLRDLEAIHDQLKGVGMRSRIEARPTLALRPQQVRVAGLLVLNGPMRSGELATTLGVSRATMTGLVDRLEQAGMVERRVDPRDGRSRLAEITESGRQILSEMLSSMSTVPDEVISRLTVEELSALVSGLNGVLRVVHLLESDAAG